MASNSTNTSIHFEVKTGDDIAFPLSALSYTLPLLFISLFILYYAFHWAHKLCVAKSQLLPSVVDNHEIAVDFVVSDPSKRTSPLSFC
jgi:hypothetical protein